jgi:uncharacterized membrane protein YhaH (DUF805 family)
MNNFVGNFVGFEGRLNRQPFWMTGGATMEQITAQILDLSRRAGWINLIVFVILLYPVAAISVKRRHDKNNAGLDVWIYLGLTLIVGLVQALGLGMTTMEIGGMIVPSPTPLLSVLGIVALIYAIYLLVVLGFLKGTTGPNNFGPDPLQG